MAAQSLINSSLLSGMSFPLITYSGHCCQASVAIIGPELYVNPVWLSLYVLFQIHHQSGHMGCGYSPHDTPRRSCPVLHIRSSQTPRKPVDRNRKKSETGELGRDYQYNQLNKRPGCLHTDVFCATNYARRINLKSI